MFFLASLAAAPDTMRAAVITQCVGSPANFSVIVPQRVPVPTPKPNEVLIKVGGSSVNPCDWKFAEDPDGDSLHTDALDHAGLEQLTQLVDAGQLRPFVQQSFGLSEVGAAFNVSMGGQVVGKLSIDNTR